MTVTLLELWPWVFGWLLGTVGMMYWLHVRIAGELKDFGVAVDNEFMAMGVALWELGCSVVWPVTVMVLLYLRARTDWQPRVLDKMAELKRKLEDSGSELEPWTPSYEVKCGSCQKDTRDSAVAHQLSRWSIQRGAAEPVIYVLCEQCFARLAEGLEPLDMEEPLPGVIDAEFEDAPLPPPPDMELASFPCPRCSGPVSYDDPGTLSKRVYERVTDENGSRRVLSKDELYPICGKCFDELTEGLVSPWDDETGELKGEVVES